MVSHKIGITTSEWLGCGLDLKYESGKPPGKSPPGVLRFYEQGSIKIKESSSNSDSAAGVKRYTARHPNQIC